MLLSLREERQGAWDASLSPVSAQGGHVLQMAHLAEARRASANQQQQQLRVACLTEARHAAAMAKHQQQLQVARAAAA